jgi:hypothetical protein
MTSFLLGDLTATPGAIAAPTAAGESPATFLARHAAGDWGEVSPGDAKLNDRAAKDGERILSAYTLRTGVRLWVITEADRSSTCVLLPEEY